MRLKIFVFIALIACSCQAKESTPAGLDADLKLTMQDFLYKSINYDSTNAKYKVEKVVYYESKDKFICEFTVHLKAKLFDTTGIMKANISKDLKTVVRY